MFLRSRCQRIDCCQDKDDNYNCDKKTWGALDVLFLIFLHDRVGVDFSDLIFGHNIFNSVFRVTGLLKGK